MSDQFIAEIRIFPFNFAPRGWAMCNGQLVALAQNTALFSLLGVNYGGNGTTTFGLPDLRGRMPMHWNQGPGLSSRSLGEASGAESVTLLPSEMPSHSHAMSGSANSSQQGPANGVLGNSPAKGYHPGPATGTTQALLQPSGASFAHNNLSPYLALNFCIALQGIFPPRS